MMSFSYRAKLSKKLNKCTYRPIWSEFCADPKMTVIGLILGSLLTPLYASVLIGQSISIPMAKVFSSIIFVVFLPMVLGFSTKKYLVKKYGQPHYQQHLAKKFPPVSTLGVLGIVFIAMALNAQLILGDLMLMLQYLLPLALL